MATGSVKNEHKNIGTGNTVSNADITGHVDGDFGFAVDTQSNTSVRSQQQFISELKTLQQMEQRRREMQKQQLEAYKLYLQKRRQRSADNNLEANANLTKELQARQKEYIKHMEERRNLVNKMMNERRQAAEERRRVRLLKMHQTSTTPETVDSEKQILDRQIRAWVKPGLIDYDFKITILKTAILILKVIKQFKCSVIAKSCCLYTTHRTDIATELAAIMRC